MRLADLVESRIPAKRAAIMRGTNETNPRVRRRLRVNEHERNGYARPIRPGFSSHLASLLLFLLLGSCPSHAKKTSGDFKLSGVNTEYVMASFAVTTYGAKLKATLSSKAPYDREQGLRFRAYRDTEWRQFNKLQLCTEKIRLAKESVPVTFREVNGKWQADLNLELANIMDEEDEEEGQTAEHPAKERKLKESPRNHYWYFV